MKFFQQYNHSDLFLKPNKKPNLKIYDVAITLGPLVHIVYNLCFFENMCFWCQTPQKNSLLTFGRLGDCLTPIVVVIVYFGHYQSIKQSIQNLYIRMSLNLPLVYIVYNLCLFGSMNCWCQTNKHLLDNSFIFFNIWKCLRYDNWVNYNYASWI